MKRIITRLAILLVLITAAMPSAGVLNESNLVLTLQVLHDELEQMRKQQKINIAQYRQFDEMQHKKMLELVQKSNQTALILYSQKHGYVFNLTYACNEATAQYRAFKRQRQPYNAYIDRINNDIDRYNRLIEALLALPPRSSLSDDIATADQLSMKTLADSLYTEAIPHDHEHDHAPEVDSIAILIDSTNVAIVDSLVNATVTNRTRPDFFLSPELQAERDSCVMLAIQIRDALVEVGEGIKLDFEQYNAISDKLKKLNDYAIEKYASIQQNIFKNGESSFLSMITQPKYSFGTAMFDIKDKYILTGEEKVSSDWKGPVVLMFTFAAIFYLVIAIIICNIIFRVFLSKRIKKNDEKKRQNFEIKKNYYITAWSMVLFSLVMVVLTNMIENNYFFKMASRLLVEFSLLISAIIASMLFRFEAQQLRHGVRLYLPIVTMGFIVILFRIIFVPNSVVNLLLPPLLLVATIFQYKGVHKYSNEVPVADKYYTWISFATILASCIASWSGFTLLAVQIFMWWMIQLTCIHGITCCYDAMQNFEKRYFEVDLHRKYDKDKVKAIRNAYNKRTGEYFKLTALYDFINMTLIPVLAVMSLPVCIYWASDIFDMKDAWAKIFFADFIDIEDVIQLSLFKIVIVSVIFFFFKYFNYILKAAYNHIISKRNDANRQANITLGNHIIAVLVWGIFFIFAMILMKVPKSGISIVTAGLATGIGFAMRDILNNFFYGISLMTGRVRVGEFIECDGIRGTVESITYQSTQMQTLDGSIIAILNSNLFAKSFKNLTRNHAYELVKLPIGVAYGTNVSFVREKLLERINKYIDNQNNPKKPDIDPQKRASVVFSAFGDSSVDLYVIMWVRIETKLRTCGEINEIIYNVLNENNIQIPFPQRDIHLVRE